MRFLTAGESHGPRLTSIIEGFPAWVPLSANDVNGLLAKRQLGYGRGRRQQIERDEVSFLGGVRAGFTTGAPIALSIENRDHAHWLDVMAPEAGGTPRRKAVTAARPGHADLSGGLKYGHKDLRDVLERASARETASRVAVGAVCLRLLSELAVRGVGHVINLGGIASRTKFDWNELDLIEASDVRCLDEDAGAAMRARVDTAREAGDTLGGIVEVRFAGLAPGLGSYVHWDRKLDGRLAGALMSIQSVKGVELGSGFENALQPGSLVHDPIEYALDRNWPYSRSSNRAGGLEGGMTTGEEVIARVAFKPIATLMTPLTSVDVVTHEAALGARERSDTTAVPAGSVIAMCVVATVLAEAYLERFGGDTLDELRERVQAFQRFAQAY